jgi:protein-tyrosine kinase
MTIVESAMERAREIGNGVPPGPSVNLTPLQRPAVTPLQPHGRIRPQVIRPNADECRENRLLMSATAEGDNGAVAAYRVLRTRLLHRIRAQRWVTIGVTSARPGDGKTTTVLNLAFSMAREKNSEVVLLDLDMRNPSVCKTLGVEPPRELRDFFERPSSPDNLFFSVGVDDLLIAGQIQASAQASELLASSRFEDLLSHVQQNTVNPIVLVDLPPLLSTDDALVLAPRLDALLLVVAEGRTDRSELERATELLSEFRMAGIVMNCSTERGGRYDYDYGRPSYNR